MRAGLRLGEALARCPTLRLVPPDPAGRGRRVGARWSARSRGSARRSSPGAPGMAWFDAQGLRTLHGGSVEGVIAAARRALAVPGAARRGAVALRRAGRLQRRPRAPGRDRSGSGAAALRAYLAPLPVALLRRAPGDRRAARGARALRRPHARRAGRDAARARWPIASATAGRAPAHARARARHAAAPAGALRAARGAPRAARVGARASQLERALGLLIDRLLARRERRGRTLRAAVLSAKLVEGGTWRARVTFREALADPRRMRLVLVPRLAELPAPAEALRLRAEGFGPAGGRSALAAGRAGRRARGAAARGGPPGALGRRARTPRCGSCAVDPDSRVPERRLALTPWEP